MALSIDINDIIKQMTSVIKETVGKHWKEVKDIANQFLQNRKERLLLLAELRISGDLPHDKFISRVEDEKLIFEAELNALAVISKAIAQKAANAAITIFEQAVLKALNIIT